VGRGVTFLQASTTAIGRRQQKTNAYVLAVNVFEYMIALFQHWKTVHALANSAAAMIDMIYYGDEDQIM
jgi:hypothetical protein